MTALMIADLHIHTTKSDGSDNFEQVLELAGAQGLTHVAFTNHDTLSGIEYALGLQERFGVGIIGGIEISAWDCEAQTRAHILGLGFLSEDAPAVSALCEPLLERRRENTLWQIAQLEKRGITVDLSVVERSAQASTCIYKQHVMTALTEAPCGSEEYKTLYRSLFRRGGICERDITYVDARDAVKAIKQDGGLAVLAHPGQFNNFALVPQLVECGLDGIEKYHPYHGLREWDLVDELAAEYDLFCTGGSDYHGAFGQPSHPGVHRVHIPAEEWQAMINRCLPG